MAQATQGSELMRQLSEGRIEQLPSAYFARTREEITSAIEELLDVGARIRPLMLDGTQVGWVRGVHLTERRGLKRWVANGIDFVGRLIGIATTLSAREIYDLSMVELRRLFGR